MTRMRRIMFIPHRFEVAALAAVVALAPSAVWGQSAGDKAAAQVLFERGKQLASEGDHASACPKFEESQRLDPGVGPMFNLADCYERTGRTASAWSLFLEVAAMMRAEPDRERIPRQRAANLEPKLSRLSIRVPTDAQVEGVQIRCNFA